MRFTILFLLLCGLMRVGYDDPHITALLPDGTIEVHSVETQEPLQVIPPHKESKSPSASPATSPSARQQETPIAEPMRIGMVKSVGGGYLVPSHYRAERMGKVPFKLVR